MEVYLTEEEQIEKIKQMWKRYGNFLLTGILFISLVTFAYHWWQQRQLAISGQAASIYGQMLALDTAPKQPGLKKDGSSVMANTLVKTYPNSPFASQAALLLARVAVEDKKWSSALQQLKWIEDHSNNASLRQIARLRYARILLAQNNPQQALNELAVVDDAAYKPLIENLRGDVYQKQMQFDKARMAYKEALASLPKQTLTSTVVQMKLDNLVLSTSHLNGANA